jgi:hypothetical protein
MPFDNITAERNGREPEDGKVSGRHWLEAIASPDAHLATKRPAASLPVSPAARIVASTPAMRRR